MRTIEYSRTNAMRYVDQIWVYVPNGIIENAGINTPAISEIDIMRNVMGA